jgi:GNAT superfamily N-acetyltransferase
MSAPPAAAGTKQPRGSWIDVNTDLFAPRGDRRESLWDHVSSRSDVAPSREGSERSFLGSTSSLLGVEEVHWSDEEPDEAAREHGRGSSVGEQKTELHICRAVAEDLDQILEIAMQVRDAGDAWWWPPGMPDSDLRAYWSSPSPPPPPSPPPRQLEDVHDVCVARTQPGGPVIGVYRLDCNKPGRGSHVSHGAYMVRKESRRRGVGRALGQHSIAAAAAHGFRAMQFNMVVSTNEAAVALWTSLGFQTVGRLPGAFQHATLGFVDGLVMYLQLVPPAAS